MPHVERRRQSNKGNDSFDGANDSTVSIQPRVAVQKIVILLLSITGLTMSFANALIATLTETGINKLTYLTRWVFVALWCCITFLSFRLRAASWNYKMVYVISWNLVFGSVITAMLIAISIFVPYILRNGVSLWLQVAQLFLTLAMVAVGVTVPRGPDAYENGRLVDKLGNVSFWSFMMFKPASELLAFAYKKGTLETNEIPILVEEMRTRSLVDKLNRYMVERDGSLSVQLIQAHAKYFILQWCIEFLAAPLKLAPSYFLYRILRVLEVKNPSSSESWKWVFLFFISRIVLEIGRSNGDRFSRLYLLVPIRTQLSGLVFQKLMRRKDVKSVEKSKDAGDEKPKQAVVNLVTADVERIAMFACLNVYALQAVISMSISFAFLMTLIGWQSLLAGLSVIVLMYPLNSYFTGLYSASQGRLMNARDQRLTVIGEALQGLRQIKFSATEGRWIAKVNALRFEELVVLRSAWSSLSAVIGCWLSTPVLLSVVALATYGLLYGDISPSTAFTAIAVFNQLQTATSVLPELTRQLLDSRTSIRRIEDYLESEEQIFDTTDDTLIAFRHADIAWPSGDVPAFTLTNLNVEFPRGELSVVSGATGSGKSLLLAGLLGEAELRGGSIHMPKHVQGQAYKQLQSGGEQIFFEDIETPENWIIASSVAFVAQTPWLEHSSIRENIVYGQQHVEKRYKSVLHACSLLPDLKLLDDGDLTEIGPNGINLSGGQRARISFARALYSRAGILILDDIFSAVDAHVAKHLMVNALTGALAKERTRVLVTHHLQLCAGRVKYLVVLANHTVKHAGPMKDVTMATSDTAMMTEEQIEQKAADGVIASRAFVTAEQREKGAVSAGIYGGYIKAAGGVPIWASCLLIFCLAEALNFGKSWWVKLWTSPYESSTTSVYYWVGIYFLLGALTCAATVIRFIWTFYASLRASRRLFEDMTETVFHMPLRWLDTVPVGRILNRFSADFVKIDSELGLDFASCSFNMFRAGMIIIAALFVNPWMLAMAVVLIGTAAWYTQYYLVGAREVCRLESISKSPILELFGATIQGLVTVRAYKKIPAYEDAMFRKLDAYAETSYHSWLFNEWLELRLGILGVIFATATAILVVSTSGMNPALAGFALSFALDLSEHAMFVVSQFAKVQLDFNSVERVIEYTTLQPEDDFGEDAPYEWPQCGEISIDNLQVKYAPELPPVLKGLSFHVQAGEKIAIVGRTGAGKSSLAFALFRFLNATEGSVCIDGIDISTLKLRDLRSRLAIIPQDPVLFSGSVRSNLDPFGEYKDEALEEALKCVLPAHDVLTDLAFGIAAGGLNISQGQRQLLCLARAIILKAKIVVFDEATSAVDRETDAIIQQAIREQFHDSTLLVIAHRLQTVVDYDRILVMKGGQRVEYASPSDLVGSKGVFYDMVMQTGDSKDLLAAMQP